MFRAVVGNCSIWWNRSVLSAFRYDRNFTTFDPSYTRSSSRSPISGGRDKCVHCYENVRNLSLLFRHIKCAVKYRRRNVMREIKHALYTRARVFCSTYLCSYDKYNSSYIPIHDLLLCTYIVPCKTNTRTSVPRVLIKIQKVMWTHCRYYAKPSKRRVLFWK